MISEFFLKYIIKIYNFLCKAYNKIKIFFIFKIFSFGKFWLTSALEEWYFIFLRYLLVINSVFWVINLYDLWINNDEIIFWGYGIYVLICSFVSFYVFFYLWLFFFYYFLISYRLKIIANLYFIKAIFSFLLFDICEKNMLICINKKNKKLIIINLLFKIILSFCKIFYFFYVLLIYIYFVFIKRLYIYVFWFLICRFFKSVLNFFLTSFFDLLSKFYIIFILISDFKKIFSFLYFIIFNFYINYILYGSCFPKDVSCFGYIDINMGYYLIIFIIFGFIYWYAAHCPKNEILIFISVSFFIFIIVFYFFEYYILFIISSICFFCKLLNTSFILVLFGIGILYIIVIGSFVSTCGFIWPNRGVWFNQEYYILDLVIVFSFFNSIIKFIIFFILLFLIHQLTFFIYEVNFLSFSMLSFMYKIVVLVVNYLFLHDIIFIYHLFFYYINKKIKKYKDLFRN